MKKKLFLFLSLGVLFWSCTDEKVEKSNYELDATKSVAQWRGYLKTGYFNEGTVSVESKSISVQDRKVTGGEFAIPLSSLINLNLPTDSLKGQLIHHLQSVDFFSMAVYPVASFEITAVETYTDKGEGAVAGANFQVRGLLSMLGKSHPIVFPASIQVTGERIKVEAKVKFDRTKWGMTYATDPALPAENYIEPVVDVHLKLEGKSK
jgi:polyisoprenoid-binding protein YceI